MAVSDERLTIQAAKERGFQFDPATRTMQDPTTGDRYQLPKQKDGWLVRIGKAGLAAGALFGGGALASSALGGGAGAASAGLPVGAGGNAGIQGAMSAGLTGGGTATGGILGAISKYAPLAQNLSSVLGGAAKSSADTAAAKSVFDMNNYNSQQNAQMNQGQLDLQRKQFDESSESSRMRRALVGALLGNMQDVNVTVPGIKNATITGGMRPSALGQNGKDLAALMVKLASEKAQAGNAYQGGEILKPPTYSGGGNSFLNSAALASSILGTPGLLKPRTPGVSYG